MKGYGLRIVLITLAAITAAASSALADSWFGFGSGEKGSGDRVTEIRDVKPFRAIEANGSMDIDVVCGKEQEIAVTFDDNLIDLVRTRVRGETLHLEIRDSYRSRRGCRIEIAVPELEEVELHGSGDLTVENLRTEDFRLYLSGSGDCLVEGETEYLDIYLSGSGDIGAKGETRELRVRVSGSGDINTRELIADDVFVKVSGSGDVKVYAKESFDGSVSGSGDVFYYGNPDRLSTHVSGSGDITKR